MRLLFSGARASKADYRGERGVLGELDLDSGEVVHYIEYETPDARKAPGQKMQFTGWCFVDRRLYVCAHNEIAVFDGWPASEPTDFIARHDFNDLHHCMPWKGGLAIANTGLETVDHITFDGELIERWDMLDGVPDARVIDPNVEYAKIQDTKPHLRHPNHLFERGGALWSTQLRTSDAVCASDPSQRIAMEVGMPHDGDWHGDTLTFTTTNGFVVEFSGDAGSATRTTSLTDITEGANQLGWCRGITRMPSRPDEVLVCFTKVRRTRWKEFGFRLKHGHESLPGRVVHYDLAAKQALRSYPLGEEPGLILFQIGLLDL